MTDAPADGPCRITGGFGTGKSTLLRAKADALSADGRRPLLLHHRDIVGFALDLLRRHGRPALGLVDEDDGLALVAQLLADFRSRTGALATVRDRKREEVAPTADEVAAAVLAYESSFLGIEELRVHADAAGELERWEFLAAFTDRYQDVLAGRDKVDGAGALVQASLLLRDPAVLGVERSRFDHLLVDDYQLATFATARLLTQLVGPGGNITVAGNRDAAVGSSFDSTSRHLDRFPARFGSAEDMVLDSPRRSPGVPTLRLVDDDAGVEAAVTEAIAGGRAQGLGDDDIVVFTSPDKAEAAVGYEWALVVIAGVSEAGWPRPRPADGVFDLQLLAGPDVPSPDERDRAWFELERRRFGVLTSRATRWLVVVAQPPVSPFLGDLVRAIA